MKHIQIKTAIPGPKSIALMDERKKQVARGPFHTTPIFIERANGAKVWDVDGNQLLDFASGIGVVNTGHTPPEVVEAIRKQAGLNIHSSINVLAYEGYVELSKKLNALVPGDYPKKTFLCNSGAEAVENAIKIARSFTKRQAVICFDHAYHGRTYMAMSLTSKVKFYKHGFAPFNPEVYRAPFPYEYRCGSCNGQCPNQSNGNSKCEPCFKAFEHLVNSQVGAENVAAVILEPVLGEGGFIPVPKEYMQALRKFCTDNGILLILDEIQSGFGRTGKMFAAEHYDIAPDLMIMAKGLGGGMPIAAVTGRAEVMDAPPEGGIGGTYCGNPVACASALAVISIFEKDKSALLRQAVDVGIIIRNSFEKWKTIYPIIGDVRGLGPMLALEFVKDRITKEPDKEFTSQLSKFCYENGVVTITAGTFGNVLRILVPLMISTEELQEGLEVIEKGIQFLSAAKV
ncbi:4-aminobutyrate--2-oxoglutarate transaminase [Leptospira sp. GIMC2001]|uniref:4-aminobutyrate--2-oxoglutarate transaminase n=1 Tax=Leptospira sp. GIMC2001 TaxID=1513297 RepID=UPI00234B51FC|nr:4-aminobutyrate--2-oxoglutarate transaminase [Leptospira sp. GIMC2001]WCL49466.1 4-aminobutyrate--2-oxoglutarate transaminase [Leptospira sp. GIMC2001]